MQTNSSEGLAHLKHDTLGLKREIHVLNIVKKYLMGYFYFNRDIVQRKTRQSIICLPSMKLECTKRAFHYHGCEVFNRNL